MELLNYLERPIQLMSGSLGDFSDKKVDGDRSNGGFARAVIRDSVKIIKSKFESLKAFHQIRNGSFIPTMQVFEVSTLFQKLMR